jgi:ribosomal protein S18 acetylase RimI-like enzyme
LRLTVLIRPSIESDARGIAEVHVRTWQAAYRGMVPQTFLDDMSVERREALWRQSIAQGLREVVVAEVDSAIVGWVAFGRSRDADATDAVGEVEAIYVLPAFWSKGVGRELWLKALHRFSERGFGSVTLWTLEANERARRFYRAAGFTESVWSRKTVRIGGSDLAEVRYERGL